MSINSTNSPITEGETLEVTATVENTGDQSDTQNVTLETDRAAGRDDPLA